MLVSGAAVSDEYLAIWPVSDPALKLPALILTAEVDLEQMLTDDGLALTADPVWTLHGGRLTARAQVRRRTPGDFDDPVAWFMHDLMPDGAG